MNAFSQEKITIAILNYNGIEILEETIRSFIAHDYEPKEIIMVDDGSSDGSVDFVKERFPEVNIYEMDRNTKNLNKVRNMAIKKANSRLVFLTDNDITIERGCLTTLISYINSSKNVAICTPRLLYHDHPDVINIDGGRQHYLGTTVAFNRDAPLNECLELEIPQTRTGGGIFLADKSKLEEVKLFDDEYLMGWGDDGELYQRLQLMGYECWHIASAVCYHKVKEWTSERHFRAMAQVYNRWRLILITYSVRTILFCLPMFVVYEVLILAFFSYKKFPLLYFEGNLKVLSDLPGILKQRKRIQTHRKVSDKEILVSGKVFMSNQHATNKLVSTSVEIVSFIYNAYWYLIKRLL